MSNDMIAKTVLGALIPIVGTGVSKFEERHYTQLIIQQEQDCRAALKEQQVILSQQQEKYQQFIQQLYEASIVRRD